MQNLHVCLASFVIGCGGGGQSPATDAASGVPDAEVALGCATGNAEKINFSQQQSCANDGSVEFCIPDGDLELRDMMRAISTSITCAPGGGRAECNRVPGLLLCTYPTAFPEQCSTQHGAMTDEVWSDMCAISAFPEITAIVATFFE